MQRSVKNTHRCLFMRFRSYILKLRNEDTLKFKVYGQRPQESSIHFVLLVSSFLTIIIVFARKRSGIPVFFSCSNRNIKSTESKEERPKGLLSKSVKMFTIPLQCINTRHSFAKHDQGFIIQPAHINTYCILAIGDTVFLLHWPVTKHESYKHYLI